MKTTFTIAFLWLLISLNSCHNYHEEDYINNCNQRCDNERICMDAECKCPPNTYSFKYKCILKDSTDLYYTTLENTILACEEQVVLSLPKKDVYTDPYYDVIIQFGNHFRPSVFYRNKYYKRIDGDVIYCEMAFSSDASERCTPANYIYMGLYGKFRSQDTLDAIIYFSNGINGVQDSVNLTLVHNN